jgi:hypothetical protein
LALAAIGTSIVREFRTARRRDEQVHPEDKPTSYDVAGAQAIDWVPGFDEYADTAIAITELEPCPVDDFAVWEKELSNR